MKKFVRYFPQKENEDLHYDEGKFAGVTVTMLKQIKADNFVTVRVFKVFHGEGDPLMVQHYHFGAWKDTFPVPGPNGNQ